MAKSLKEIITLFEGLTGKGKLPSIQRHYDQEAMKSQDLANKEFERAEVADERNDNDAFDKHHYKGLEHSIDYTSASTKEKRARNLIARGSAYKTWKKTKELSNLQRKVRQGKLD